MGKSKRGSGDVEGGRKSERPTAASGGEVRDASAERELGAGSEPDSTSEETAAEDDSDEELSSDEALGPNDDPSSFDLEAPDEDPPVATLTGHARPGAGIWQQRGAGGVGSMATTGRNQGALSRRDPFQAYLREVQRYPLLTAAEESSLTREYQQTGDVDIAARLVTANLRLVIKIAYEYRRAYRNIMDLIQEGNIGLMQAVKRYDPYRGVKLSSYAAWWIRAYMLRFILNNWRLVKVGTTQAQRKLFFNLNKQKARLASMGIEPTAKEIAERLGVQEKEVVEMDRRMSGAETSLDAPLGDAEGRTVSRSDLLPSSTPAADDTVADQEVTGLVSEHLKKFRATLAGKDVIIFDRRMVAEDPMTLQKLGDEFGVSRERVRQLEARLAGRLREFLKEHLGDAVGPQVS